MAYKDALTEVATISTTAQATSPTGSSTEDVVALYSNIPCRVHRGQIRPRLYENAGTYKPESEPYILITLPQYNAAKVGDRVVWDGKTFTITIKGSLRGRTTAINHMAYTISQTY